MRRALVLLCLATGVAHADRAEIAETRACRQVPQGVTTQLVGDRLFLLRDDGIAWNALWVLELAPRPTVVARIDFAQIKPRAFRVVDGRLFVVGALPPEPPPPNVMGPVSIVHPPRVIVMNAQDFSLEPHENAAGFLACEGPPDDAHVAKAARAGGTTVVAVRSAELWPGDQHLVVLHGRDRIGELDHHELALENLGIFCSTLPPYDRERACGEQAVDAARRSARFDFLAIRWGVLISASSAGVAVHDLVTLADLGGVSLYSMQGMSPTISLR